MADEKDNKQDWAAKQIEGILKKALSIGAEAYSSAGNVVQGTLNKTLNTVQMPKDVIKQALDEFIHSYTIKVNAEITIVPKNKEEEKKVLIS